MTSNLQNIFNNALYQSSMLAGIVGKPLMEQRVKSERAAKLKEELPQYQKNIEEQLLTYESRKGSAKKITPEEYAHSKTLLKEYEQRTRELFSLEPSDENILWGRGVSDYSHRLRAVNEQEKERAANAKIAAAKGQKTKAEKKAAAAAQAGQNAGQSLGTAIKQKRNKTTGGMI